MVSFESSDVKKVGKGLTGFGILFTLVGVMLFFDKAFVAIGNILLLLGGVLTAGPESTLQFFLRPSNLKGNAALLFGFVCVLTGWTIPGMIVEAYGFMYLFRGFGRTTLNYLKKSPVLGSLIRYSYERMYYGRPRGRRVPV